MKTLRACRRRRAPSPARDQDVTPFTPILQRLVDATPGGQAAALVDYEGETVDYVGDVDTFELKVSAAHWQLVFSEMSETSFFNQTRQIVVRARGRGYVLRRLPSNYVLLLIVYPHAAFSASQRTLEEAEARLRAEAGWPRPAYSSPPWFRVDVETPPHDRCRPIRLRAANGWQPVEVMGCMVGLKPREKGFRVRLPSGAEMLLVRERPGRWFADEHFDEL
jgi:hypothetical protein